MAKGRMLSMEEILKMDGKYVFINPIDPEFKEEMGVAFVKIGHQNNAIEFYPVANENDHWRVSLVNSTLNTGIWLDVYELIEEPKKEIIKDQPKKYSGIEILQMIKDGDLKEGDKLINYLPQGIKDGESIIFKSTGGYLSIENIVEEGEDNENNEVDSWDLINMTFSIKPKEYLTFDEARKSGKKFKHVDWCDYRNIKEALHILLGYSDINQIMDQKVWEVQE